jgi:hypothetical protein
MAAAAVDQDFPVQARPFRLRCQLMRAALSVQIWTKKTASHIYLNQVSNDFLNLWHSDIKEGKED